MNGRLLLAGLALGASACAMIAGVDGDYHTVEKSCESAGRQCVGAAPLGFLGPISFLEGVTLAERCPAEFPLPVQGDGHVFAGLDAVPPATCACSCDKEAQACGAELTLYSAAGCGGDASEPKVIANGCADMTVAPGETVQLTFRKCEVDPVVTLPELSFASIGLGCRAAPAEVACGQGVCVPPLPPSAKLCVFKVGDVDCPAAGYSEKKLYHGTTDDTRDCAACSCGNCGEVELYALMCDGSPAMTKDANDCLSPPPGKGKAKYVTTKCKTMPTTAGVPEGTATLTDPVTLCCTPAS